MANANVKPAEGKLGIMVVGNGAVATTFMTGVLMTRKGLAKPVGSMTQYDKIRIGRGADLYMWCNIGQMTIQLALVLLLYSKGIIFVVIAYSALSILWLGVWQIIGYHLLGLHLLDVLKDVVPFLMASLLVMAVTYVATCAITSLPLLLASRILMAVILYAAIMKFLQAKVMDECLAFLKKQRLS